MSDREKAVEGILFGPDVPLLLMQAHWMITDGGVLEPPNYEDLVELIRQEGRAWQDIARVVEAAAVANWSNIERWLGQLSALFDEGYAGPGRWQVGAGVVLGLVRILDRVHSMPASSEERKATAALLVSILHKVVLSRNRTVRALDVIMELHSETIFKAKREVQGVLSEAISGFSNGHDSKWSRRDTLQVLIGQVVDTLEGVQSGSTDCDKVGLRPRGVHYYVLCHSHSTWSSGPSAFGKWLLDQFAFTCFNKLNVFERLVALASLRQHEESVEEEKRRRGGS